jgi:transcriptional regulator with PAS, ATPase and Fis domain
MEAAEKQAIEEALAMVNQNRKKAAKLLDISERALFLKIKKYRLPGKWQDNQEGK